MGGWVWWLVDHAVFSEAGAACILTDAGGEVSDD